MSSLQKFHRRTNGGAPAVPWPATALGGGDETHGFWLGDVSTNKLIVAPKSTELQREWGSHGTVRGATSYTNGLANTNTLAGFGQAAHPAAYYCKYLTTGGYNTWYMPARDEQISMMPNKAATPFAINNGFEGNYARYVSSTELDTINVMGVKFFPNDDYFSGWKNRGTYYVRPVRRTSI